MEWSFLSDETADGDQLQTLPVKPSPAFAGEGWVRVFLPLWQEAMSPVRRQISAHASRLRRDMTDAERSLWRILRNRQLNGFKFRRQASIGPFVVDFLCVEAALVIEIDGGQHDELTDRARTEFLEARGLNVMRFWNHEVLTNLDGVAATISDALVKNRKTLTQPSPAKAGEG